MKTILYLLVLISASMQGQQKLDTIYANDRKNVALFFPEAIRQGITGSKDFVFTYNREKGQNFGLLQARSGVESNLLAITTDGQVYAYILKFASSLSKLNYFINPTESIGNEKREIVQSKPALNKDNYLTNRITYFQKFSAHLLKSKFKKLAIKHSKRFSFSLCKMVYDHSEVYLVLEIKNKSEIDFEIDYLNIYTINGNNKRKASYQKLKHKVIYTHKMPTVIPKKDLKRIVVVVPKFVLNNRDKLLFELREFKGSRSSSLKFK